MFISYWFCSLFKKMCQYLNDATRKHIWSMKLNLKIRHISTAFIVSVAMLGCSLISTAQIQIGQDIEGEALGDESGTSISMPDAHTIAIGAIWNDGSEENAGHVRVYTWNTKEWIQKGQDIDGEATSDVSGWSVSMPDANTVAIGAIWNKGNGNRAGHVRIYSWDGRMWMQRGQDIDGESEGDRSGWSVSMPDANTVAIGAYKNDGTGISSGHVRIFTWDGTAWRQKGLDIDGEAVGDRSGYAVSMPDAHTVAIGAYLNDGNGRNSGHVRVFHWNGKEWMQQGQDIDGKAAGFRAGYSVSMPDGNTVAIGADFIGATERDTGRVLIYTWNGKSWIQKGHDILGKSARDLTGQAVSMPNANTVAIGAFGHHGNGKESGLVYIMAWNGTDWVQIGQDIIGRGTLDWLGWSVSMPDVNTIGIGAKGSFNDTGYVQVYSLPTVGIIENSFIDLFSIYPNPTKGHLLIAFSEPQQELRVSLFTMDGKLLETKTDQNISELSYEFDAPAGVYLLKIANHQQEAFVRVVKE